MPPKLKHTATTARGHSNEQEHLAAGVSYRQPTKQSQTKESKHNQTNDSLSRTHLCDYLGVVGFGDVFDHFKRVSSSAPTATPVHMRSADPGCELH